MSGGPSNRGQAAQSPHRALAANVRAFERSHRLVAWRAWRAPQELELSREVCARLESRLQSARNRASGLERTANAERAAKERAAAQVWVWILCAWVCVRACVRGCACVRACVGVRVRACMCGLARDQGGA
eukprot:145174-Chlamydomonas_euryale.AAC.2